MRLPFLTPPADLVSADGRVEPVHEGGSLARLRPKVWLLARDLCTFQLFEAGALPRGRRRQAATLFARTASPYVASGVVVVPAGPDFGVWWWDLERISALLPAATAPQVVRPETLAQPAADGWRIVRLSKGFEGQLWRSGRLLASNWRLHPFDAASWTAFVRVQRDGSDAPAVPPVPTVLPIADDSEAFSVSGIELSQRQAAIAAAGGTAFVVLLASLFFTGQGLRLADDRRALELETAELRVGLPPAATGQALDADRRRLAAYAELEQRTNPLSAAGAALGIVSLYDLEPRGLETDAEILTIRVSYSALEKIDELAGEFENSGYFYDVQPRTETATQTVIIEMKVRSSAAPLGSS